MKRTIEDIQWEIDRNNSDGIHTFSMCECGRGFGSRGRTRACNLCLKEELEKLMEGKKK